MKQVRWFPLVLLLGLVAFLAAPAEGLVVRSLDAASAAGGTWIGNRFVIRDDGGVVEVQPAVAYNPDRQEYLVVFWNDRLAYDDIRAERVSRDGRQLGGVWVAAGAGADRRRPDVVYNSQAQEYLVVWEAVDTGGNSYIRGQRLRGTDAQLQGGAIPIHTVPAGGGWAITPAVAYASTADKYLVVWESGAGGAPTHAHILGRSVSSSGTPSPAGFFFVSQDPGGMPRSRPDLAYNRHGNGFLVVWEQWDGASWNICGQLVNGDGIIPPSYLPIKIVEYFNDTRAPAVAAISTAPGPYKYLVVFEDVCGSGIQPITGRLVEENGTLAPTLFPITSGSTDSHSPAVAGTESGHRYLVIWEEWPPGGGNVRIHGRAISHESDPLGQEADFPGVAASYPVVAAGPVGDFLVAFDEQSLVGDLGVYGHLWGNRVYLPLVVR